VYHGQGDNREKKKKSTGYRSDEYPEKVSLSDDLDWLLSSGWTPVCRDSNVAVLPTFTRYSTELRLVGSS
jgi:hypothetical protein